MQLSEEQILDFKKIQEKEFNKEMSYSEASELAHGFFELASALYELDANLYDNINNDEVAKTNPEDTDLNQNSCANNKSCYTVKSNMHKGMASTHNVSEMHKHTVQNSLSEISKDLKVICATMESTCQSIETLQKTLSENLPKASAPQQEI